MPFELNPTPILSDSIITLHPQHPTGFSHAVPGAAPDELSTYKIPADGIVVLREAPLQTSTVPSTGVTVATFTETLSAAPQNGQFFVNYVSGTVTFHTDHVGADVTIVYAALGSFINTRDINSLSSKLFGEQGATGFSFFAKLDGLTTNGVDFSMGGDLSVAGDLNVTGVVNKTASEVLNLTDNILLLNSGQVDDGAPTTIVGLEVARSANPQGDPLHPQLVWDETDKSWDTKSTNITYAANTKLLRVRDRGGMQLQLLDNTEETTLVGLLTTDGVAAAGTVWFNDVTFQFKGWNGSAVVILG